MKKDKTYWALELLQIVFFAVVPIALFIAKCTSLGTETPESHKFILGCSGYIVLLVVFIGLKKFVLKKYLKDLSGKIVNFETQLETETDETKIDLCEKALHKNLILRDVFNVAPFLIIIGIILLVVKAIENDIVQLYAVLGLIAVSYLIGFILMLVQHANIKSKNRKVADGTSENTESGNN